MNFITHCDPMACRNTKSWWMPGSATSDRLTDELVSTGMLSLLNGSTLAIAIVYPQSLVKYVSPRRWKVEALTGDKVVKVYKIITNPPPGWPSDEYKNLMKLADGTLGVQIGEIEFPEEPVDRTGPRTMTARSITSTRGQVTVGGVTGDLTITLPDVAATPFAWYLGGQLGGFTVGACDCPSTVEWK